MTIPSEPPTHGPVPPNQPSQPSQPSQPGIPQPERSQLDPAGVWTKFLSGPGGAASPDDVKKFIEGTLKFFNIIIQRQNAAYQRANQHLKDVIEGRDT